MNSKYIKKKRTIFILLILKVHVSISAGFSKRLDVFIIKNEYKLNRH